MYRVAFLTLACGMMVAYSAASSAQPPAVRGGRPGGGISHAMLLRQDPVKKDLGLSTEQIARVDAELGDTGGSPRGSRDMSDDERRKAMDERAKLIAAQDRTITNILDTKQLERLKQIRIQVMGARAIMDESVAKQLRASDEQVGQLRDAMQTLRESGEGMAEQRDKLNAKVMEILTPDQKAKLKELEGAAFDTSQLQLRGGGRRGGE